MKKIKHTLLMDKIYRFLLSAALLLCCTFSALADLGTPPNNEIWYTTDNNSKLTANKYDVGEPLCGKIIKEHGESNGHYYIKFSSNITLIGEKNFEDEDHLTEISMPNSVTKLGYCAFYNCNKLKNLTLSNSLGQIGYSNDNYGVFEECDELETVVIPASVTTIGQNAFYDCDMLKFVAIGSGVTEIYPQAFYQCAELKSVAIDNRAGLMIDEKAFKNCKKLESVSFLGNTPPTSFGSECFYNCPIKYHVLEECYETYDGNSFLNGKVVAGPPYNEIWYTTKNGGTVGYSKPGCFPKLNIYIGSHGVQFFNDNPPEFNFEHNCFFDCEDLVSVVLPSSITSIGRKAFDYCTYLVSVSIPSTVTSIGERAFHKCERLQVIKLPAGLNHIDIYAFASSGLKSITVPSGVNSISEGAFAISNLCSVTFLGTITNIGKWGLNCGSLNEIFYLGDGTPRCVFESLINSPATIYVKDVTGHDKWYDRPVCSWRSGRGDGSAASPLEIESYPQLYGFSLEVEYMNGANLCARLTADINGSNNVLNEDGTPNGVFKQWLPIGREGNGYRGEFDGGGHTVSGLYFNDGSRQAVGLFGKAAGPYDNPAYMHDVGVKDSYFRGKSHVAGICGDLAIARMENCWNAATVQARVYVVGGMAGSCWYYASISNCHNAGMVSEVPECGGISGSVYESQIANYSLNNCFSLDTKCSKAYTLCGGCPESKIHNVSRKNASAFTSGEICWILNGNQPSAKWRQQLGTDSYPTLTGNYLIYKDATSYHNETVCWVAENHLHSLEEKNVTRCDGSANIFWHCTKCGKGYQHDDKAKELPAPECSAHLLELVDAAVVPTASTTGHYDYWHCTNCGENFLEDNYSEPVTSEQLIAPVHSNDNEILYTSVEKKIITPNNECFGATITDNRYQYGLGTITFDGNVTSIGKDAFNSTGKLQSINIPSSVTGIESHAFYMCYQLQSANIPNGVTDIGEFAFNTCISLSTLTFHSIPHVGQSAFTAYRGNLNIKNRILDLTDSDKPYIGTSLDNYPAGGFTEARYHGTLEPGEWGTITLPFVPSSHPGIVFFSIDNVDAANGTLTLSIAGNIVAGRPYLFRNQTDDAGFTLTATPVAPDTIVPVNIYAQSQSVSGFALKGAFQADELTGTGLYEQRGNEFVRVSSLGIDPFRAYLKDNGGSAAETIVINCDGVLVTITNQDDSTVTLYGLKKVEFIKENDVPAVRVTNADDSIVTYENPKKAEFGK